MAPRKAATGASRSGAAEDVADLQERRETDGSREDHGGVAAAERAADEARERTADHLVRLAAAHVQETLDPRDPAHARWFDRRAVAARAALSIEERAAVAADARTFAAALLAGTGRASRGVALVPGAPVERPAAPVAGRDAMQAAESARCALRFDLAVAAGVGRELWDEPATSWVELPASLPAGQHVALTVRGDSMEPLLHAGDTILVKLGGVAAVGDVVVARRPEHGHVVKRVAAATAERLVLASLNASYDDVIVPQEPGAVLGTVVLRWCAHRTAS